MCDFVITICLRLMLNMLHLSSLERNDKHALALKKREKRRGRGRGGRERKRRERNVREK